MGVRLRGVLPRRTDRVLLPPLERQREATRHLLAVLTGHLPADAPAPTPALEALSLPAEIPLGVPAALVTRRPDVRAAEANLHAATATVGVSVANLLPQLSLDASFGSSATATAALLKPYTQFWSAGASLTQTLFALPMIGTLGSLRADQLKLERDYAERLNLFKPEWPAMQQLRDELASIRWRSGGSFSSPVVVREPFTLMLPSGEHREPYLELIHSTGREVVTVIGLPAVYQLVADLGEAIRLNPNRAELFVARGAVWERLRDATHAIADYDEAIGLDPKSAAAYNNP